MIFTVVVMAFAFLYYHTVTIKAFLKIQLRKRNVHHGIVFWRQCEYKHATNCDPCF